MQASEAGGAMRHVKALQREEGFTLLEVLVAMTIFSIGVLALAQVQFAASANNMQSRMTSTASSLASDRLEEIVYGPSFDAIRAQNFPNEAYGAVDGGNSRYAHFARTVAIQDSLDIAGRVSLKTVRVRVTWHALHGDRHVELMSRVAKF
jgi:type IV pilus modification protein PilV